MKTVGLFLAGGAAAIMLLANLGHMVELAISLAILYWAVKKFLKTDSAGKKILWGIIGAVALTASAHNVPAILGVGAAVVLYMVYKKWNENKDEVSENDPFTNFDKQWAELKRK